MTAYVHGYSDRETLRLQDQADTLTDLLHSDTRYPAGSRVLEAGCGVGAQTVILARNSPKAQITSIDISRESVEKAQAAVRQENLSNVRFRQADLFDLPFAPESFDHVFLCFVLEHLEDPANALSQLRKVLKKGGSVTVIEGDHGSYFSYPESRAASLAVQCLVDVQAAMKGNALIGRQLFPLLRQTGFEQVHVSPRMVYTDAGKPSLAEGFIRNTFTAMVAGVREQALSMNLTDAKTWDRGIADLMCATGENGTFCYTFFKGTAIKN